MFRDIKSNTAYTRYAESKLNKTLFQTIKTHGTNSRTYDAVCASGRRPQHFQEMLHTRLAQDRCIKDMEQHSKILGELAKELSNRGIYRN